MLLRRGLRPRRPRARCSRQSSEHFAGPGWHNAARVATGGRGVSVDRGAGWERRTSVRAVRCMDKDALPGGVSSTGTLHDSDRSLAVANGQRVAGDARAALAQCERHIVLVVLLVELERGRAAHPDARAAPARLLSPAQSPALATPQHGARAQGPPRGCRGHRCRQATSPHRTPNRRLAACRQRPAHAPSARRTSKAAAHKGRL